VSSEEWESASAHCAHGKEFHKAAVSHNTSFWRDAAAVVVLTKPIMDAIHQLEADSPLLSQVTMVWRKLEEHVAAFTSKPEYNKFARDGLKDLFAGRLEKHHHDAFYAAFALDPIHFQRNASGSWSTPCSLLSSDEQEAAQAVFTRLACSSEAEEMSWHRSLPSTASAPSLPPLQLSCPT
jgi:hypothetical protein